MHLRANGFKTIARRHKGLWHARSPATCYSKRPSIGQLQTYKQPGPIDSSVPALTMGVSGNAVNFSSSTSANSKTASTQACTWPTAQLQLCILYICPAHHWEDGRAQPGRHAACHRRDQQHPGPRRVCAFRCRKYVRHHTDTHQRAHYGTYARYASRALLTQSLAREFGEKNIHVAHIVVDGLIESKTALAFLQLPTDERFVDGNVSGSRFLTRQALVPDQMAKTWLFLAQQHPSTWTAELDLRPAKEKF